MCSDNLAVLTQAEVEIAVRALWDLFASKKIEEWQNFYADVALVFGSTSKRAEPARLTALRRRREYLASAATVRVEIPHIDVELLGPDCGVAIYLMRLGRGGHRQAINSGAEGIRRTFGVSKGHPCVPAPSRRQDQSGARTHFRRANVIDGPHERAGYRILLRTGA